MDNERQRSPQEVANDSLDILKNIYQGKEYIDTARKNRLEEEVVTLQPWFTDKNLEDYQQVTYLKQTYIDDFMRKLSMVYQGDNSISADEVANMEKALVDEKENFNQYQRDTYDKLLDLKESYDIHRNNAEGIKGVRYFDWPGKHKKAIIATVSVASVTGVVYGVVKAVSYYGEQKAEKVEKDAVSDTKQEQKQSADATLDNGAAKARTVSTTDKTVTQNSTLDEIKEIYTKDADRAAEIVKSARANGLSLEADEIAHLLSIANLHNLTEDQKLELASAKHPLSIEEWMNFTDKVKIDLVDVTPNTIAFDAKLLFGDTEAAKDANYVMHTYAKWNATHDTKLREEFKNFLISYTEDTNFKQKLQENPAAVEFVLNASSIAYTTGIELLDDEQLVNDLFYKKGSQLSQARMALGADLQIDQTLFKDDTIKITDESMSDTATLQKSSFLKQYDDNKILQVKFVANQMNLSSNQEKDLANKLDLNDTLLTWVRFGEDYVSAIEKGENFDANDLFLNDEKMASELNKAQSIYQSYLKAGNAEKAILYDEWNELYYRNFLNDQDGMMVQNKPGAYLLAQLLQSANAKGLNLEKADVTYAKDKDKNGTVNLYKIIVGDGLSDTFCNTINDVTIHETGREESHRTFWEETYSDLASSIRSVSITSDKDAKNANESLYAKIVLEGRENAEKEAKEGINRHDVFVQMIEERIKDFKLQNVTNPEDALEARLGSSTSVLGGYTLGTGVGTGDVILADESGVTFTGSGSEVRDNNLELWTQEQITETEKNAEESKNQEVGSRFEPTTEEVVESNTKTETIFTEQDKKDNDEAANNGSITPAERDEMNQNGEHFEGGGDVFYSNNVILSDVDLNSLMNASDIFASAEEKFNAGTMSEEDFQKAVEKFDAITNDIFGKYDNSSSDKVDTSDKTDSSDSKGNDVSDNTQTIPSTTTREDLVKYYQVNLQDFFEYEGSTFYYSESTGSYVDLETLTLPNEIVSQTVQTIEQKVVEEKVIDNANAVNYNVSAREAVAEQAAAEQAAAEQAAAEQAAAEQAAAEQAAAEQAAAEQAAAEQAAAEQAAAEQAAAEQAVAEQAAAEQAAAEQAAQPTTAEQIQELENLKQQMTAPAVEETQSLSL